ncbi:MAG: EamA/RhaT family transporter, partial [Pseudomonadota bacterium]
LLLSQLVIGAAILAPVGATQIPAVSGPVVALTLASAAASMLGNLILLYMSRRVEASRLAPMVYFQLLAATGLGLAVFGDLPDGLALLGLVLLAGSGFGSALLKDR